MDEHELVLNEDDDGWIYAECACGYWQHGPFVSKGDAIDAWGDHRAAVG